MSFYIAIDFIAETEEDLELILDGMYTTQEDLEPELLGRFAIVGPLSAQELGAEMFCLGASMERIERTTGINFPFDFVVLENRPDDEEELDLLFEAKQAIQLNQLSKK